CRWAWCRQFFSSSAALAGHVISVHLVAAQPVSRGDLPMLRRVEEGYSQSFEILSRADFEAVKSPAHIDQLPSSLPSPPPSTPTSLPSAAFPSPTQQPRTPPVDPAIHKNNEPSFASLSSPAESHLFSPCIPESPSLSRMISDAVRAGERLDDSPSKSSTSSLASVEQQLTPNLDDTELSSQNFPSQPSARQHTVTIPVPRKPPLPFNNRGQRQAWYQTRPKQRKRPTMLSVVVSPESSLPQSPSASNGGPAMEGPVESQFPYQTQASYDSQL
ncbi:hypothetical protein F5887DRAFT_938424, partial [Amanita rubescens]